MIVTSYYFRILTQPLTVLVTTVIWRGGLLQTLGSREERWHNQSLAVDDGFNLSVEVTNHTERFYLYRTIKLINFLQFYMAFICKEKVLVSVRV